MKAVVCQARGGCRSADPASSGGLPPPPQSPGDNVGWERALPEAFRGLGLFICNWLFLSQAQADISDTLGPRAKGVWSLLVWGSHSALSLNWK